MNIYDFLMVLQLLFAIGIFITKFYNVMSSGQAYDMRWSFILFVGYFIAWGLGFTILMMRPEKLLFHVLFKFETWLIGLNVLFFIVELFFSISDNVNQRIKSHKSIETGKTINYMRR